MSVDRDSKTATVGAGALLGRVYYELSAHNLTLPGGSCASVGVAGLLVLGGKSGPSGHIPYVRS